MTIFYFTGTGNSLSVAKALGGKILSIPQVLADGTMEYSDDAIGIVFPVYCLGMPKIVRRFLSQIRINTEYGFVVCTYGCMCFGAAEQARNLAIQHGFRVDYADSILMLDNFLPFFDVRVQKERLEKKNIPVQLSRIVENIRNRKTLEPRRRFGALAISGLAHAASSILPDDIVCRQFHVTEACVRCGICAQVCPAGNVLTGDGARFGKHCEGCLACIHACPQNAIHIRGERSCDRWRNPDVSLVEIIKANSLNK